MKSWSECWNRNKKKIPQNKVESQFTLLQEACKNPPWKETTSPLSGSKCIPSSLLFLICGALHIL